MSSIPGANWEPIADAWRERADAYQARCEMMAAALRALVEGNRGVVIDHAGQQCLYCQEHSRQRQIPLTHRDDCPIVAARRLLADLDA